MTTDLSAGYLRKNGVPYSDKTILTEYYDRFAESNGDDWFTVTTIVTDQQYLGSPFVTTTDFKRQKTRRAGIPGLAWLIAPPERNFSGPTIAAWFALVAFARNVATFRQSVGHRPVNYVTDKLLSPPATITGENSL